MMKHLYLLIYRLFYQNQRFIFAKNILLLFILFIGLIQCGKNQGKSSTVSLTENASKISDVLRQPAEFEPQDAVWLIWPPEDHIKGMSNEAVTLDIINALASSVKIIVTAKNDTVYDRAIAQIPLSLINKGSVVLHKIASEELWVRDMGPNFVILHNGEKAIVDFNFDAWGYTPHDQMDDYTMVMEKYDEALGKMMNLRVISTDLYSEGGDREVNGKGTLMVVEAVERNRNPEKTKKEIEEDFKELLGVSNIIWLKQGVYEDEQTFMGPIQIEGGQKAYTAVTTGGHIDEFARFVNENTILLAEVPEEDMNDPVAIENKKRLEDNYNILKNAKDQDGQPFKIIRVPTPKTILHRIKPGDPVYDYISTLTYRDGSIFPVGEEVTIIAAASYLNFFISNTVVVAQKYWREGLDLTIKDRDIHVAQILQDVFPQKKIIMIDALAVNFGGGGIHCITMQEPASK